MKKLFSYLLVVFAVMSFGCSNADKKAENMAELIKGCSGKVTLTYHIGNWSSYLEATCEDATWTEE